MSDIKKNARKLMVYKKEQKLMNFTENNNSNQSITEERNLLSAYGNTNIKTPYCEEENINKITRKHERVSGNRENIKKELVFNKFHEKITFFDSALDVHRPISPVISTGIKCSPVGET